MKIPSRGRLPPLFIGRFQPFHTGHLDAVKQILEEHPRVIIGIGSAQSSGRPKNPFPATMRRAVIRASLREARIAGKRFTIVLIPDIHNSARWVAHVEKLSPPFGQVWSGTALVKKLFRKDGKHEIIAPRRRVEISGTEVRRRIRKGKNWEAWVSKKTASLIKNHYGH